MSHYPLVSVVMPTYNRAEKLAEAIDSVLVQDYYNFELIVVDDGSTDNTLTVLDGYKTDITVIRQENSGVSTARNRGITMSSGGLIAFLDSDDLWLEKKLSTQVAWFLNNPGKMICQTEETWMRRGRRVNPKTRHKKLSGDIFIPSLSLCLVSPSAVMMRRALFDEIGMFDPGLPVCEDYDLWLRAALRYPFGLIDTPLIVKRGGHADQLSAMAGLDRYRIYAIEKLLQKEVLSETRRRAAVRVLRGKCAIYATGCEKRGRKDEAAGIRHVASVYDG